MKQCPNCKVSWEDPRGEIPDVLSDLKVCNTREQAEAIAKNHGWTPENGLRFKQNVMGVQYPYDHPEAYDGCSEWICDHCNARIGRWSGKVLADDESEKRLNLDESQAR